MAKYAAVDIESTLIKKYLGCANTKSSLSARQEFNVTAYPFVISSQIAAQTIPVNIIVPSYSSSPSSFSDETTVELTYTGDIHGSMPKKYKWTSYPHLFYYSQIVLISMSTNPMAFSYKNSLPTTVLNNVIPPYLPIDGQSTYAITVEYYNGAWNTLVSDYYLFDRDVGVLTIYGNDSVSNTITNVNPPRISYWKYEGTFGLAGAGSTGSTGPTGAGSTGPAGPTGPAPTFQRGTVGAPTAAANLGTVVFPTVFATPPVVIMNGDMGAGARTIIPLGLAGVTAGGFTWLAGSTGSSKINWIAFEGI